MLSRLAVRALNWECAHARADMTLKQQPALRTFAYALGARIIGANLAQIVR